MEISNNHDDFAVSQRCSGSQPDAANSSDKLCGQLVGVPAGSGATGSAESDRNGSVAGVGASPDLAEADGIHNQLPCPPTTEAEVERALDNLSPETDWGTLQTPHCGAEHELEVEPALGNTADNSPLLGDRGMLREKAQEPVAKKPVSIAKIEANRQNALQSTGPKTLEGKERSRWNSTKHGLLGKRLLIVEGAGAGEWAHLLESLRADLQPVGVLEELLVEKIAKNYWRLQMADGYEVSMARSLGSFFQSMDKMGRYQTAIGRQLARDIADLKRLQKERGGSDSSEPREAAAGKGEAQG